MKFTIIDIITERTPFGNTIYQARAEDGTAVRACIPNANTPSNDLLLKQFVLDYQRINTDKSRIQIGDVLE